MNFKMIGYFAFFMIFSINAMAQFYTGIFIATVDRPPNFGVCISLNYILAVLWLVVGILAGISEKIK